MAEDLDRMVTVREASARLGVSRATGYRMLADGEAPFDGTVTVTEVRGVKKVSLRQLAEFMYGAPITSEAS